MMRRRIRHCPFMFIAIPSRQKSPLRWATPLLFAALWGCFTWATLLPDASQRELLLEWGALSGGLTSTQAWQQSLPTDALLRLFSALFLHAHWAHLPGNLGFRLIFGLRAERAWGPGRSRLLSLL